jgi:1,4-alpha-glucan branching enzyme
MVWNIFGKKKSSLNTASQSCNTSRHDDAHVATSCCGGGSCDEKNETSCCSTHEGSAYEPHTHGEGAHHEHLVSFTLEAPTAKNVYLSGTFNGWSIARSPLSRTSEGRWQVELPLPHGQHQYRFVVDGAWVSDPRAKSVPNPYGSQNNIIEV